MLLFSKIYEFYCLYGIEILLSGATGAARQNSYEGLHIFSYEELFTTFYHFLDRCITFSNFLPILHMKLSYIYYSGPVPVRSEFSIRSHTVIVHCAVNVMPSAAKLSALQLDYMQLRHFQNG